MYCLIYTLILCPSPSLMNTMYQCYSMLPSLSSPHYPRAIHHLVWDSGKEAAHVFKLQAEWVKESKSKRWIRVCYALGRCVFVVPWDEDDMRGYYNPS